jgi:hypothetical protein
MAARELKRPVKVVYTRTQMYTGHGYRPYTIQKIALGAERSGKLTAMIHEAVHNTSTFEEFNDNTTNFTRQVYACPNLLAPTRSPTPTSTPTWMRAPGRGQRHVRARMRDGRAGLRAQDRPARTAPHQLRRDRPGERQAVVEQGAARVLPARRGEVRLEESQDGAALDARRAAARRLGHGHRRLGRVPETRHRRSLSARTAPRTSPARRATSAPALTR